METTTTPTATVPTATDPADTANVTVTAEAAANVTGTDTPADVATLLARLAQVTGQLVTTIRAHTGGNAESDADTSGDTTTGGDGDGGGRVGMSTAGALLAATDRLTATVIAVLASVSHRGVIADEGISAAAWLRTFAARTIADERMLSATVDRLADMPTVRDWFFSGEVSWPVVRGIVAAVRNLTREQRRWVDDTLTADPDRTRRLDADELVGAVQQLADRARPDLHRDREQRAFHTQRFRVQLGLDGTSHSTLDLDAEGTATLLTALDNTHATTDGDGDDGDDGDGDDGGGRFSGYDRWRQQREWSNAQALLALCRQRLGHPNGAAPTAARPSLLAVVDIDALVGTTNPDGTGSATAQLLSLFDRGTVELTPQAAQRLACDATLRYVLVDGAIPLGVTAAEPKVSATLRAALVVRDGGCRFASCHQPADACDNHHVIPVAKGGPTTLDNLVLLCLPHHHAVHDSGWTNRLHPDGTMTFTRRGVTITSLPRRDQRFAPTRPPPTGRPTRPYATGTDGTDDSSGHTDSDPRRDPNVAAIDPDPPPDDLPF